MSRALRRRWPLLSVLAVAALARLWGLGAPALIGDEAYYWLWSKRLALSYYDHPSGVALLVGLSRWLGGEGELGVRWFNAALGLATVWLSYALGERLFSRRAALIASACVAVAAPYLVTSRFAYGDALQHALLVGNLCLLLPFLEEERSRLGTWRFWTLGLTMALLLNTKYGAYLYAAAVLSLFLTWRRDLLRDRRSLLAIGIALIGLLPTLLWNAAHGWASFRWQIAHATSGAVADAGILANLHHFVSYFTPPVMLLAFPAVLAFRRPRQRIFLLLGLLLVVPVLLSPANSPRSATAGMLLLLILGVGCAHESLVRLTPAVVSPALGILLAATALYGAGTVRTTLAPTRLPHAPVADALRLQGAGWRQARALPIERGATVFAVDYGLPALLGYYGGYDAYSAWGQYRLWGVPAFQDATIIALPYVDPKVVGERLRASFRESSGPVAFSLRDESGAQELLIWRGAGRKVGMDTFLDLFDLMQLIGAGKTSPGAPGAGAR